MFGPDTPLKTSSDHFQGRKRDISFLALNGLTKGPGDFLKISFQRVL